MVKRDEWECPRYGPPKKITPGWLPKVVCRFCDHTQPRLNPHCVSHQRQPSTQPNTCTDAPAGNPCHQRKRSIRPGTHVHAPGS